MDQFKQHKETEGKVHEALYTNLVLLTGFYPPTKAFDAVFRRDMFVKNNKAASFEVLHYLLNTLNPELTKERMSNWPLNNDVKRESKLRSEIIAYINILNSMYEHADIPTCQASHLISPGGYRFAKFVLKISQLVLHETFRRTQKFPILHRIRQDRIMPELLNTQKCNLEKQTKVIESNTKNLLHKFAVCYEETKQKAEEMQAKLKKLNQDIGDAKKKLSQTQEDFIAKYPSYPSLESLKEKLVDLKQQTDKVLELDKLFSSCEKLLSYLGGSTMTLEHNEANFTVPLDIAHVITNTNELNLCQFIQGVATLLEKKTLYLQSPTTACIEQTMEALQKQHEKDNSILKHVEQELDHINHSVQLYI